MKKKNQENPDKYQEDQIWGSTPKCGPWPTRNRPCGGMGWPILERYSFTRCSRPNSSLTVNFVVSQCNILFLRYYVSRGSVER